MSGPLLFLLLFQLLPALPPAQAWLEEAHRQAQRLPAESRVHALQRLSVWARNAAPALAEGYFREAFEAASNVPEADRKGRIQYQLVRDLAETAPSRALDLALEMGEYDTTDTDWRLYAAAAALEAWGKRNPVAAAEGLERLYSAGIPSLELATRLLRSVRTTHPELAKQTFQRSVAVYQSIPHRDLSMMAQLIFQSQAMLSVNRESALWTLRLVLDDVDDLAKSGRAEAPAAPGLRALALDTLRQANPEEAAKLAQKDPETEDILKQTPAGFSTPPSEALEDPAPGLEPPRTQSLEGLVVDRGEQREVNRAVNGLSSREKEWTPERLAELASQVSSPVSRARLRTAIALSYLSAKDEKAESAFENALASVADLYDAEPSILPALQRESTELYRQLIAELARRNPDRALTLAKRLPGLETRFEVLFHTTELLWTQSHQGR